jgi:hypothetical protein
MVSIGPTGTAGLDADDRPLNVYLEHGKIAAAARLSSVKSGHQNLAVVARSNSAGVGRAKSKSMRAIGRPDRQITLDVVMSE